MKDKKENNTPSVTRLSEKFDLFSDHWTPKIIATSNGQLVKIAKVSGDFVWHSHENEDELFYVVKGELIIDLPNDKSISLLEGEMTVIPRGMEHRPRTKDRETWIMMIEPPETLNTGQYISDRSVEKPDWI